MMCLFLIGLLALYSGQLVCMFKDEAKEYTLYTKRPQKRSVNLAGSYTVNKELLNKAYRKAAANTSLSNNEKAKKEEVANDSLSKHESDDSTAQSNDSRSPRDVSSKGRAEQLFKLTEGLLAANPSMQCYDFIGNNRFAHYWDQRVTTIPDYEKRVKRGATPLEISVRDLIKSDPSYLLKKIQAMLTRKEYAKASLYLRAFAAITNTLDLTFVLPLELYFTALEKNDLDSRYELLLWQKITPLSKTQILHDSFKNHRDKNAPEWIYRLYLNRVPLKMILETHNQQNKEQFNELLHFYLFFKEKSAITDRDEINTIMNPLLQISTVSPYSFFLFAHQREKAASGVPLKSAFSLSQFFEQCSKLWLETFYKNYLNRMNLKADDQDYEQMVWKNLSPDQQKEMTKEYITIIFNQPHRKKEAESIHTINRLLKRLFVQDETQAQEILPQGNSLLVLYQSENKQSLKENPYRDWLKKQLSCYQRTKNLLSCGYIL